jgi:signal transduction histidine kinase
LQDSRQQLQYSKQQLQDAKDEMLLLEKMVSLGTLTAGVAQEIKAPTHLAHVAAQDLDVNLQQFQQYLHQCLHQWGQENPTTEMMSIITQHFNALNTHAHTVINGTEQIQGIVKDLHSFIRMDESEKRSVHLSECLHATLHLVRTHWQDKIEFITEFTDDPAIECWPSLLSQVFMHLLMNGCHTIDEKRQLHEAGESVGADAPQGKLWLRLHQRGGCLLVEFEDSGMGISAGAQEHIMKPFFTTKTADKGTGLGLSIAFGIAQKHAGALTFTSTLGRGSCFTLQLPLTAGNLSTNLATALPPAELA